MPESKSEHTNAAPGMAPQKAQNKKSWQKILLRIVIWLLVIAAGAWLVLFLAARIGEFDSISSMLEYIRAQF